MNAPFKSDDMGCGLLFLLIFILMCTLATGRHLSKIEGKIDAMLSHRQQGEG
jgi:hypothetical protein